MGRKNARGSVPVWLVAVAFTQLFLTLWFVRNLSSGTETKVEERQQHNVEVAEVDVTPLKQEKPLNVTPLDETTLDRFILFPKIKEIRESKESPEFDQALPSGEGVFFSIVIAAYNQGSLLQETVDSVFKQTFQNWELIIVDDGSSDNTWDVANTILARNQERRIKVLKKENGGLSDARNYGMRFARGNWLCMLDSDDLLEKGHLSKAASLAAQGVDIVVGCMENFDAVSSVWCFPEGYSVVGLSHWNKFHASVLMSARLAKSIGGYDQSLLWGLEDWNFWLSASRHRPRVMHLPEITFYYRHHRGSSMRKEMFRIALEDSKAMVRTNHPDLFEPYQLLLDNEKSGANQNVHLHQSDPGPVLVSAWSQPEGVAGIKDDGYSLYIDITYTDGSNEWGYILSFDPSDPNWQRRYALVNRSKPISQMNVYCMLRGHKGRAYFDDVVVAPLRDFGCACISGEMYMPSKARSCVPCPKGKMCVFGYPLIEDE